MMDLETCYLKISQHSDGIALLTLDMPGRSANILDSQMFDELDRAMEQLAGRDDLQGLIVNSAKPGIFIAGADLTAISHSLDWPEKDIIQFCQRGRAVMARFSRTPFPTVAAIHGACVGGGLELALWCDYRVATSYRRTVLGLPEVLLGLVPGWAGTVRLPRLIGFEPAADLIIRGQNINAESAAELGFVDQVVDESQLIQAAANLIDRVRISRSYIQDRQRMMGPVSRINRDEPLVADVGTANLSEPLTFDQDFDDSDPSISDSVLPALSLPATLTAAVSRLGKKLVEQSDIYPYAPTVVLEHMARTAPLSQKEGWQSESLAMAQVWGSPANRGLLNCFFLTDRNKKDPGWVDMNLPSQEIKTVAILGAGLMGQQIAASCIGGCQRIFIYDIDHQRAAACAAEVNSRTIASTKSATGDRVVPVTTFDQLATADLVIETIVEHESAKLKLLRSVEPRLSATALLASNTSAIPITRLAQALAHPERFCGIHFCHPELMSLVEVVGHEDVEPNQLTRAVQFVRKIRKAPLAVKDGPGFVVNRLLAAMLNEALRMFTQGLTIQQIDLALREFGFQGGPFEIVDTIGIDTCVLAGQVMYRAGLDCISASPILPVMVKKGRLGRKSGKGFYQYEPNQVRGVDDPVVETMLAPYQVSHAPSGEQAISGDQIANQIVRQMVCEAKKIYHCGLVKDYRDIDFCAVMALSFPQHRGGPLFWSDQAGFSNEIIGDGQSFYQSSALKNQ